MKLWESVVEGVRTQVNICEQLFGFMQRKGTTDTTHLSGEEQRRLEGAALCLCRSRESL